MKNLDRDNWPEFEEALQEINDTQRALAAKRGCPLPTLLFRGLGSGKWGLETTLERSYPLECHDRSLSLLRYYHKIGASKPSIETFSGGRWDKLKSYPDFKRPVESNLGSYGWLDMLLEQTPDVREYLVYLRHHGFPSPLLDWSASPYVAAFFAFDSPPEGAERVAVYAFLQDVGQGGSSEAHLFVVGPHLRSDPRHFLQQCSYSMCVAFDLESSDYQFRSHELGLGHALGRRARCSRSQFP